jgi:hypothetical protein
MKITLKIISLLSLLFCIGCHTVEPTNSLEYKGTNTFTTFTLYEVQSENIVYEYYPSKGAEMKTVKSITNR